MKYIVSDLEATCWEDGSAVERMEVIEIGAVKLDGDSFENIGEFSRLVRPLREPQLTDFCTRLTSIRQEDVDAAGDFKTVFPAFLEWIGEEPIKFCTWSTYDLKQLQVECERNKLPFPKNLESHIDLRQLFAAKNECEPCSMEKALEMLKLPLEGAHHRGLDDSRNIVKIALDLFKNKKGGHVEVVPYDSQWPSQFKAERDAVLKIFGSRKINIEHVGSTALPGMAAKPTIDLMIGEDALDVSEGVVSRLTQLGYRYFGEYSIPGRHFFRKGMPPTHHIHWVENGSDFWKKQIIFRDYMRAHPKDAAAYENLKKDLAHKYHDDRDKYTLAKTEFIESVNKKALEWDRLGRLD